MKRVLIAALIVLGGAGGVLFYYWQQATQLPSWYTEQTNGIPAAEANQSGVGLVNSRSSSAAVSRQNVETKIAQQIQQTPDRKNINIQLDPSEINNLFTSELNRKAQNSGLGRAVKGTNTTIQNGTIASGAVVNLSDISVDQLPQNHRQTIAKLITAFPQLSNRKIYVGIEGQPTVRNGQVQLNDNTRIKLGDISLTPAELADRLGVSEEQVRRQIELHLQVDGLTVKDIEIVGDRAVVRGSAE